MWFRNRSKNLIFWIHIFLLRLILAKDTRGVSSVTEVKTEVIYVSQTKSSFATVWGRRWFSKALSSRQASNCGSGLLSCNVEDPTRIEPPWHGVAAPFPQCYDPALYVCSENFLCPIGAPKIEGQYACGPYKSAQSPSLTGNSGSSSSTAPSQSPPTGGGCGPGTLLCEVEDPTRLEAPWHGVSAPFPQCYDPALYTCSEYFLCPICAPKIPGQYACGPYISPCPQNSGSGGGTGISLSSSSSAAQTSSSLSSPASISSSRSPSSNSPSSTSTSAGLSSSSNTSSTSTTSTAQSLSFTNSSSISSTQSSVNSESFSTILPTTLTFPNGSHSTISGTTELLPTSSSGQSGSVTSVSPSISTGPNGSLTTISGTMETVPTGSSGTASVSTIPPSVSTGPNGSLTTISGTTETFPNRPGGSGVGSGNSVTTVSPSVSTEPNGSLTTISGTTETLPSGSGSSGSSGGSVTVISPSVSTEPDGSLTTISGTTETLPSGSGGSVSIIPPSVSTEPDGSLTTIPGTTETLSSGSGSGSGSSGGSVTVIPPSVSTEPDGSLTTISGTTETLSSASGGVGGSVTTIPPSVSTEPDGSLTTISGTTERFPTPASQTSGLGGIIIGGSSFKLPSTSEVLTEPNGETITLGPGGVVIGSDTISFPSVTAATTLTSDGLTFTLEPGGVNSVPASSPVSEIVLGGSTFAIGTGFRTVTEPDGSTIVIGPSNIVVGSDTIPFPSPGATLTTDGITLGQATAAPSSILSTSNPPSSTGPLPTFTTWPSDVSVSAESTGPITTGTATTGTHIYVTTSSRNSQGSSSPFLLWVPRFPCLICGCWFCPPGISGFDFFGIHDPGIYPPPPPGIRPPGFSLDFPSITIGYDGNPTYSSEPESDKQTSTKDTSSSSCSTLTATDCTDFVSYGVNTAGSTTASATSSKCNTVTSCSASDFTTTTFTTASCTVSSTCSTTTSCPALFGRQVKRAACATSTACSPASTACPGTTTNYIVYPASEDGVNSISNILSNDFKIDTSLILTSQSKSLGFNYWDVPLTTAQYNSLNGNTLVGSIYPKCTQNCYDASDDSDFTPGSSAAEDISKEIRDGLNHTDPEDYSKLKSRNAGLVRQANSLPELVHISLGPKISAEMQQNNYIYDSTGGAGSTVYIIDTGANLANPEFTGFYFQRPRWIFAGTANPGIQKDTGRHGTSMLSKVSGDTVGIAKSTNNVVVLCPAAVRPECVLDGLGKILDELNGRTGTNTVVLMALHYPPATDNGFLLIGVTVLWRVRMAEYLNKLANLGVVLVTGSGNQGTRTIVGWPAKFALSTQPADEHVPSLIVLAATNPLGAKALKGGYEISNTDPNVDLIWAPGWPVQVANADYDPQVPDSKLREATGTSEAAATAAGLCAYFLGLTNIDANIRPGPNPLANAVAMKTYLQETSFQRLAPANIPTVWNGVTSSEEGIDALSCPLRAFKRQEQEPDYSTCSVSSSSTSTSSTSSSSTQCTSSTASICTETITFGVNQGGSTTMTASSQSCSPTVGCSVVGATSTIRTTMTPTTTTFISCSNQDADPGLNIFSGFCVCSGSTFSQSANSATPANSCAYTTLPTITLTSPVAPFPVTTNTAACQVCTRVGPNEDTCNPIPNCTKKPPPVSTGVAIADFFACPMIGYPCGRQWEIFPIEPPTNTYPGCSTDGALYSTVVTTLPVATAAPTLGPFSVDGQSNCFFRGNGLSCIPNAKCSVCSLPGCSAKIHTCDVFGVAAAGYGTDLICEW